MTTQPAFYLNPDEIKTVQATRNKTTRKTTPKSLKVWDCSSCGLCEKCRHPKISMFGKGKKGILLIGLCPGFNEDKQGFLFVGASGDFLKRKFRLLDIDLDRDCYRTNIVQCYPGKDKNGKDKVPNNTQIKCCRNRLLKDIEEAKPKLIICLGTKAIQSIITSRTLSSFKVTQTHGLVFPNQEFNCWAGASYHPAYFLHKYNKKEDKRDDIVFINDLADILGYLDKPVPKPLSTDGNELIINPKEAVKRIEQLIEDNKVTAFDYETTTLSSHSKSAKIATVSLSNDINKAFCVPVDWKDKETGNELYDKKDVDEIKLALRCFLASEIPKVVQNFYMEELWSKNIIGQNICNFIHDTMVTAHILNCRRTTTSLDFQTFNLTGHVYKDVANVKDIYDNRLEDVAERNNFDSRYTLMSYYAQKTKLESDETLRHFNDFYVRCLPVLSYLTDRGVNINVEVIDELEEKYNKEFEDVFVEMLKCSKVRYFEEIDKKEFKPSSWQHVSKILYKYYGELKVKETATGSGSSTDESSLLEVMGNTKNEEVKTFITSLLRYRKCKSMLDRCKNYKNLLDQNNIVHPTYNLNIAATFRSTATDPNIQNVFNHDDELKIFRRCVIPRKGNMFLSVDYSSLEVRVIAMMSKDPVLSQEIIEGRKWLLKHTEGGINPWDTHRKWGAKIFQKALEDVDKDERYKAKNNFVFPSFYGAIPKSLAKYPAFIGKISEKHIQNVYDEFWETYKDVRKWQQSMVEFYNVYGCYVGSMGCVRPGPLSYFQLFNNIIQGNGFHLLLDGLERIDNKMIDKGMKSWANMEIHDDITFDAVLEEKDEIINLSTEILCSKRFDWQWEIPLDVEWKVGAIDGSWFDMKGI